MATRQTLPVLPLRGTVIFPGLTAPIAAGRPGTLRAIEAIKAELAAELAEQEIVLPVMTNRRQLTRTQLPGQVA